MPKQNISQAEQDILNKKLKDAFLNKNIKRMEAALQEGADASLLNEKGEPLIFVAGKEGRIEEVELLLKNKASVISPKGEHFLFDLLEGAVLIELEKCFLLKNLFLKYSSFEELSNGYKEKNRAFFNCLNELINLKPSEVNKQDKEGNTPLHLCAAKGVKPLFLRHWPDLEILNHNQLTPLDVAKEHLFDMPAWFLLYEQLYQNKKAKKGSLVANKSQIKKRESLLDDAFQVKEFEVDKEMALMEYKAQKIISQLNKNLPLKQLVLEKIRNEKE